MIKVEKHEDLIPIKEKKDEYHQIPIEDVQVKDNNIDNENSKSMELFEKIKNLFGEKNTFLKENEISIYENLNDKQITFIGIRDKNGFENGSHWAEQNSWFVNIIKNLDELKNFKVLKSEDGIKDLVLNIDDSNVLILSFRTTNLLENVETFSFPVQN